MKTQEQLTKAKYYSVHESGGNDNVEYYIGWDGEKAMDAVYYSKAEAEELVKIHKNIVIKIPMTLEGLKAVKILAAKGIKTNVTLIFSATQALMAARAGATYVSPFLGRVDDIGSLGMTLIEDIVAIFDVHGIETEIIAASIRNPLHVVDAARVGCHIATIPYNVLIQMAKHPLTDIGIEKFLKDWESVPKK